MRVRLGEYDLKYRGEPYKHEDFAIHRMIVHEDFKIRRDTNDIALLELAEPVIFKHHIAPICVRKDHNIEPGETVFYSGWDLECSGEYPCADQLRREAKAIEAQLVDLDICRSNMTISEELLPRVFDGSKSLCANPKEGKACSCRSDPGGSLFVTKNDRAHLIGVTSSFGRCSPECPALFTSVASHFAWIIATMRPFVLPDASKLPRPILFNLTI